MPAKIARSAPRPPFGLPEVLVAVRSSRLSCRKAEKREYSRSSAVIRGMSANVEMLFRQHFRRQLLILQGAML